MRLIVFLTTTFIAFLICNSAMASVEDGSASIKTRANAASPKGYGKTGFSLVIPSVVVHGIKPDQEVAGEMRRKVDDSGRTVVTPGLGLQYEDPNSLMVIGAAFKDCYDNAAGTLQIGQHFKVSSRTNWGYTIGVYARETPMSCETTTTTTPVQGRPGFWRFTTTESCSEFDSYPLKFLANLDGTSIDIIPMPFLHFSTAIYKDKDFQVDFKIMTNYVLNEFGIGIPF